MNKRGEIRWWEIAVTLTLMITAAICVLLLLLPEEPAWRKFYAGFTLVVCIVGMLVMFRDSNSW